MGSTAIRSFRLTELVMSRRSLSRSALVVAATLDGEVLEVGFGQV